MSFLDSITGFLGGPIGALGGKLLGGFLDNQSAADRQEAAQQFSAQQYATRYQTQVADMKAAGLNPMLAYTQAPGNSPGGVVSTPGNQYSSAVDTSLQARLNSAQVANIAADTKNKEAEAELISAQAAQARASAWQQNAQIEKIELETKDMISKLENNYWASEVDRIRAVARELQSQYDLNIEKGLSEQQSRGLMLEQAYKLRAETRLLDMDFKAGQALDNLGRTSKELKPAVDILTGILRSIRK